MRIYELFEHLFSMSDYAEIKPFYDQLLAYLRSLTAARVQIDINNTKVRLQTEFENKPLTVTYQLRTRDQREFRAQLAAAYRSWSKGRPITPDTDIVKLLSGQKLGAHAWNFLSNPKKWDAIELKYNNASWPQPPGDARPIYQNRVIKIKTS